MRVRKHIYSVHSRLIGYHVSARLYAEHVEVYVGSRVVQRLDRAHGDKDVHIDYRHIIDWLVRKLRAFANYRYQASLFPSSYFRIAYDRLCAWCQAEANREYVRILHLAARGSETLVNQALRRLLDEEQLPRAAAVHALVSWLSQSGRKAPEVTLDAPDLTRYDSILSSKEVAR